MNRLIIILCVFSLSACFFGNRPFPKRFLGEYSARQEAYELRVNGDAVTVPASELNLRLEYDKIWLTTPKQVIEGKYVVKGKTKQYYTLLVELENGVVEEWQLHGKNDKLIRKAISPQPLTIFLKD